jgi:hypothetical protein
MRGFQNCACDVVVTEMEGAGEKQGDQKRVKPERRTKPNKFAIIGTK